MGTQQNKQAAVDFLSNKMDLQGTDFSQKMMESFLHNIDHRRRSRERMELPSPSVNSASEFVPQVTQRRNQVNPVTHPESDPQVIQTRNQAIPVTPQSLTLRSSIDGTRPSLNIIFSESLDHLAYLASQTIHTPTIAAGISHTLAENKQWEAIKPVDTVSSRTRMLLDQWLVPMNDVVTF